MKILQNTLLPIEPRSKVVHGDGVRVPEPHHGKLASIDSAPNLLVIGAEQTESGENVAVAPAKMSAGVTNADSHRGC